MTKIKVVFGVTCSSFVSNSVIKHHLNTLLDDKRVNLPEDIILKLRNSFYVDNGLISVDTQEELQEFIKKATTIFVEAQLDLRLWEFTILDPTYEEKHMSSVLGMI